MDTKKNLQYYMNRNWSFTIEQDVHEGQKFYIIRVNELPAVCTDAFSIEEGMTEIQEAIEGAIELYLAHCDPWTAPMIREPIKKEDYKRNIAYRTTRELHFSLAKPAQHKHISMNKALDMFFDAGMQQLRTS